MERRRFKRISFGSKAEFISGGNFYEGIIENLSEDGITVLTTRTATNFTPGTPLELYFQPAFGKTLSLNCKVKWSSKAHPQGMRKKIGMEIIDPSWDESDYFL